jgi:hypothetical protein
MRQILLAILAITFAACTEPTAEQSAKPQPAPKPQDTPKPPDPARAAGNLPDNWKARLDDPSAPANSAAVAMERESLKFTSGPAGFYYKPNMKAEKDYELTATFSQLKPSVPPEPYGLFIGGVDLDKEVPRYTAFLIRQDGQYQIASRNGDKWVPVVDWKPAKQMADPKGVKTSNTLTIRGLQGAVHFLIGDREVHQMPRARAGGDGIAGVRVGKGMHIQVDRLAVKKFP